MQNEKSVSYNEYSCDLYEISFKLYIYKPNQNMFDNS